ncbi:MAG TPA: MotA/TolQ/ExbB proton channel family protein [Polyangiaceae bacterium]|jgi:biopolymer transport protein ExbB
MLERVKSAMVGLGAGWVLILMFGLSIISVAVMLERAWLFISLRDDIPKLMRDLASLLRAGDWEGARRRLEASPSAEAAVVVAGLIEAPKGPMAAEEAMAGASALQRNRLERRLAFLGTVGNNAPFIGLLGTVIGIVAAFDELAREASAASTAGSAANAASVSATLQAHISEALVATAVGLFVAIPAVAAYNYFQRVVKGTLANTEAVGHLLLAHLKSPDEEHMVAAPAPVAVPARREEKAPTSKRAKPSEEEEPREEAEG